MTITDASNYLNSLLSQTDKKYEKKTYNCFIKTLTALQKRDFTKNQIQLIEEQLSVLNLKETTENRKKSIKQKHTKFRGFLKNKFFILHSSYYTEKWMIYGMIFGTGLGISIGTAINPALGTSIGLSIGTGVGMALGIVFGSAKDAEAKKQDRVL